MHAQATNEVGLSAAYWGVEGYHSHPQLIGPVVALWTRAAGYSEASIRLLALSLALITTAVFAYAIRSFLGAAAALSAAALLPALPIVYVYGKKLDQENLLIIFLALQWWAISLLPRREQLALALAGAGSLFMMMSDWSAIPFAIALGVATYLLYRDELPVHTLRRYALISGAGIVCGLALFLLQSYLQSGVSFAQFIREYYELWLYRAGAITPGLGIYWWLYRQFWFISDNFTFPLFAAGASGLYFALRRREGLTAEHRRLAVLAVATFAGSLAFLLIVPQASGIHAYFQFYWALPVAVGLVCFAHYCARRFFPGRDTARVWCVVALLLFPIVSTGRHYYTFINENTWGDQSDIALLRHVNSLPSAATIIAAEEDPLSASWFAGPNIHYYSGRDIRSYVLATGVPFADYQIVPRAEAEQYAQFATSKKGYGTTVRATTDLCSTDFCIIHLVDRAKH
jgi:hypothetical protein